MCSHVRKFKPKAKHANAPVRRGNHRVPDRQWNPCASMIMVFRGNDPSSVNWLRLGAGLRLPP